MEVAGELGVREKELGSFGCYYEVEVLDDRSSATVINNLFGCESRSARACWRSRLLRVKAFKVELADLGSCHKKKDWFIQRARVWVGIG